MGPNAFSSATNIVDPASFRHRGVPDVPQDVEYLMDHLNDPNFDYYSQYSDAASELLDAKNPYETDSTRFSDFDAQSRSESARYSKTETQASAFEYNDESPYAEVRAAVTSIDDPTIPANTFRTWFLGIMFATIVCAMNQFFQMRYPSVFISGFIVQLIALPFGKALERLLPTTRFCTLGYTWSLNPGPFNVKEHVLITVIASAAGSGAYVTDLIATQQFFYNQTVTLGYQLLLAISTQLIGFSLGGFLRPLLVYPTSMIWPGALVNCALFNTLHRTYGKPDRHISRHKFFLVVASCSFAWYFVPGFLWTGLSIFNWVCWIAPNNVVVNTLFGTSTGLGMGIFTFDWAMVSFIGNPLVSPWWSEANIGVGFVFCFWIIAPILYFTDSFFMGYLPLSSSSVYDNTGMPYDPTRIVTNGIFDLAKYEAYSPAFLPTTLALGYGIAFATLSSLVVHCILWYRRDIIKRFRGNLKDERDVHSRLMQAYAEVPQWWYVALGVITLILLFVTIEVYHTELPIWAACIGLLAAACLALPIGIIQAITNQQVALNVVFELFAGYMVPGRPVAVMIFKSIGYTTAIQAVGFAADMKLGHYMKIPPRLMFSALMAGALVASIVSIVVQNWMFANIVDLCQPNQPQSFTCPGTTVFATSSLIWGGIGPQRVFSSGALYNPFLWSFLIGAVLPVPFYYLARKHLLSYWRYANIPVIFAGISAIPPATGINYTAYLMAGFFFQWFMRRYHYRWWTRYNYILAIGLDSGLAVALVFIFFTLQMPKGGVFVKWWGNTVWQNTADVLGTPLRTMPPGQTFGPSTW